MRGSFGKSASFIITAMCAAGCATVNPWASAVKPPEDAPVAAPAVAPDDILGKPASAVDAILGAPALVRREGPGEYRRYAYDGCTLIVILYPDDNGAVKSSLLDAVAVKSGEDKPDLETCLASVR